MRLASRSALLASILCLFAIAPAQAQPMDVQVGRRLLCDTQKQAERYVALLGDNAETAADRVNEEEKDPTACAVATVRYVHGPEVATARNRKGSYQVIRILVIGVAIEAGIQATVPAEFFSIVQIDEREA